MTNKRSLILQWTESGHISPSKVGDALSLVDILPTEQAWRSFIDRLLLWFGALALAISLIFFFAYNWDAMGHLAKFGLIEALIIATLIGYWKTHPKSPLSKTALMVAAILVGALLALFGQTYQTGADPWQLFAYWALLISPWVVIARLAALWLLWIALINLSLFLYFSVFGSLLGFIFAMEKQLFLALLFNTLTLGLWEWGARHYAWLDERWAVRLLAVASGTTITFMMLQTIFDWNQASGWVTLCYPVWLAGFYFLYRHRIQDLFMLAGGCFSLIVVVTGLLARSLLEHADVGGFLFIAMVIIGMSSATAMWLRRIHVEHQ